MPTSAAVPLETTSSDPPGSLLLSEERSKLSRKKKKKIDDVVNTCRGEYITIFSLRYFATQVSKSERPKCRKLIVNVIKRESVSHYSDLLPIPFVIP